MNSYLNHFTTTRRHGELHSQTFHFSSSSRLVGWGMLQWWPLPFEPCCEGVSISKVHRDEPWSSSSAKSGVTCGGTNNSEKGRWILRFLHILNPWRGYRVYGKVHVFGNNTFFAVAKFFQACRPLCFLLQWYDLFNNQEYNRHSFSSKFKLSHHSLSFGDFNKHYNFVALINVFYSSRDIRT